ncbi:MAG: NAD(P)-dependent oxidoreductase [archaeon]|nr:NAD(P)-dependent oxidoreductase [archaeon]
MRILITGVTGFIGGHLAAHLKRAGGGEEVVGMVRRTPSGGPIEGVDELRRGGFGAGEEEGLREAMKGADAVVHLAGEMDFFPTPQGEARMAETNVEGTRRVVEAAVAAGVRRVIYVSSTEAVGPTPAGVEADEEQEARPTSAYGRTKLQAERAAQEVWRSHPSLELIILRPTGVYGPGDTFSIAELLSAINLGLLPFIPGPGDPLLMYTHVADVCEAICLSIHCPYAPIAERSRRPSLMPINSPCVYHICPDAGLSYAQWIELCSRLLGRAPPLFRMPLPLAKTLTRLLAPVMNLGRQRTFLWQADTVQRMAEHRCYSNTRARQDIKFAPRYSIPDGLRHTISHGFDSGVLTRHYFSPTMAVLIVVLAFSFYLFHLISHLFSA